MGAKQQHGSKRAQERAARRKAKEFRHDHPDQARTQQYGVAHQPVRMR